MHDEKCCARQNQGEQRRSSNTAPDAGVNGYSTGEQILIRKKEKPVDMLRFSSRKPEENAQNTSKHNKKKTKRSRRRRRHRTDWRFQQVRLGFCSPPRFPRFSSAQFDRRSADNNSICYNSNPQSRQGHLLPPQRRAGSGRAR